MLRVVRRRSNNSSNNVIDIGLAAEGEGIHGFVTSGGLPFDAALDLGLAVIDAPGTQAEQICSAFITAYPVGQFSEFVCTEVA